jgi:hypothetical protein
MVRHLALLASEIVGTLSFISGMAVVITVIASSRVKVFVISSIVTSESPLSRIDIFSMIGSSDKDEFIFFLHVFC